MVELSQLVTKKNTRIYFTINKSVSFYAVYLLWVTGGLKPIPAGFEHKARYTLNRAPTHHEPTLTFATMGSQT